MIPRSLALAIFVVFGILIAPGGRTVSDSPSPPPLRCLIVGGGPDRRNNPVALENNIAYVGSLLPQGSELLVLYANADLNSPIVRVETTLASGAPWVTYRRSQLRHVDGAANLASFQATLGQIESQPEEPILLYFTGHGSPDISGNYADNAYDLWGDETLTVSDLSAAFQKLPPSTPVTLVMVQCFSGAFANVFFAGSERQHPVVHPGCGFFASIPQREAAGCTPDINQADYRDFTTYFFGALTGRDRVGRAVPSADYDHDGVVKMDEAFAYTLANDRSIDTPMATSDAYVRRFTETSDQEIFQTPYSQIVSYATPAQRMALGSLSGQLRLSGNDRPARAFAAVNQRVRDEDEDETEEDEEQTARWIRFVRLCKTIVLEHQILADGPSDVRVGLVEIMSAEHQPLLSKAPAPARGNSAARFPVGHPLAAKRVVRRLQHFSSDCGCAY